MKEQSQVIEKGWCKGELGKAQRGVKTGSLTSLLSKLVMLVRHAASTYSDLILKNLCQFSQIDVAEHDEHGVRYATT